MSMRCETLLAPLVLLTALLVIGCVQDSAQQCLSTLDTGDHEATLEICTASFDESGNVETLVPAAAAAGELGEIERMLELAEMAGNSIHGAAIYQLAANYVWEDGDDEAAKSYFLRSVELYRDLDDNAGAATSLYELHSLAWQTSDHRRALTFANESLQAAIEGRDVKAQVRALNGLFNVLEELGSLGPAELALQLVKDRLGSTITPALINARISQGLMELNREQYGLAAHEFGEALTAAAGSKNTSALRGLHLNIVHANIGLGRTEVAREHMKKAWSYAEPDGSTRFALLFYQARLQLMLGNAKAARSSLMDAVDDEDVPSIWMWELHYWAGRAAEREGRIAEAKSSYRNAIIALEAERAGLSLENMKAHLLDEMREPYEALFGLLAREGDATGAITVVEQVKGRSFVDALVARSDEALTLAGQELPIEEVSSRIDAIQSYVNAVRETQLANVRTVDATLKAVEHDEVLTFFLADEDLWIIRTSQGEVSLHKVRRTSKELQRLYSDYRANPDDSATLSSLGDALFPLTVLPPAGTELYIAPDGDIGRIGIASLLVDSQYLIERHELTLIPNLNTLISIREKAESAPKRHGNVVLGDPLGDLPNAALEAEFVASHLGTAAFTGNDADLRNLVSGREAKVMHIATHSGTGHLGPWLGLANGNISMTELMQQQLAPSLAVLASCISAGTDTKGLWGSLAGVFLSSGAKSALAALWSVPDDTTRIFMERFYQAYAEHPRATTALALAQRAAIQDEQAPRDWAGFVLLGGVDDR